METNQSFQRWAGILAIIAGILVIEFQVVTAVAEEGLQGVIQNLAGGSVVFRDGGFVASENNSFRYFYDGCWFVFVA